MDDHFFSHASFHFFHCRVSRIGEFEIESEIESEIGFIRLIGFWADQATAGGHRDKDSVQSGADLRGTFVHGVGGALWGASFWVSQRPHRR